MARKILLGSVFIFVFIQFFRPIRNESKGINPDDIFNHYPATENVKAMIRTSCYDCHSNNTSYPWYADFQPFAWWLNHHIEEGKDELNFSDFAAFNTHFKSRKLDEIMELVKERNMPLPSYLLTHTEARLSDAQRKEIIKWAGEVKRGVKLTEP